MCKTKLSIPSVACALRHDSEEKDSAELQMQYFVGTKDQL
jgi:hypothetical protein